MEQVGRDNTLGLYLSIPFCRSKCTFCNFASDVYPTTALPAYLARLVDELRTARTIAAKHQLHLPTTVDTVYFGGGTPSLLSPGQLSSILAVMREEFDLAPTAEITLEASPVMLEDELLAAAREFGVNRVSFGVQTFVDAEARVTGRLHTAAQALADIGRVRGAGLQASVDLIAGLPGQTAASWRQSLVTLAQAAPEHASIYMLEVDEDSRLGSEMLLGGTRYGAALSPSDDAVADFYAEGVETLAAHGLQQYEISNFARTGCESRHNLRYWQRRPYLGIGLDAHSMLRDREGRAVRFGATDNLAGYLAAASETNAWNELHRLDRSEELEEAWFLGLRCNVGVSTSALEAEFGGAVQAFDPVLASLLEDGLLQRMDDRWQLTARGRMLSNDVFARFLDIAATQETGALALLAR